MKKELTTRNLLLIIAGIAVLLPFIAIIPGVGDLVSKMNGGVVGDAIGGITSPFINGIAAILVFVAFKEQIKANNPIKEQQYFQHVQEQLFRLEDDFMKIAHAAKDVRLALKTSGQVMDNKGPDGKLTNYFISEEGLKRIMYVATTLHLAYHSIYKTGESKKYLLMKLSEVYDILYKKTLVDMATELTRLKDVRSDTKMLESAYIITVNELDKRFKALNQSLYSQSLPPLPFNEPAQP